MVSKNYCMSSFLAFRRIVRDDMDFYEDVHHRTYKLMLDSCKTNVDSAHEIDVAISTQFEKIKGKKLGLLLSGGMDSAILASYMRGQDAYTFRFLNGGFQETEMQRAEYYANYYGMHLHYVDINWEVVYKLLPKIMSSKGAPIHSIEPQILAAALQAQADGIDKMIIGDAADYVFGGMDKLLAHDWLFDDFVKRYIYINPAEVLVSPVNITSEFEDYRLADNKIDYLRFMNNDTMIESYGSYENAFHVAKLPYLDPYETLKLCSPLNLKRIRNGESKYLIRELFQLKYPGITVPEKNPMPRPVDMYFKDWAGPQRVEFRKDIPINQYNGNQKWLLWCLEEFLTMFES